MTYDETKAAAHIMLEWAQAMEAGKPITLEGKALGGPWSVCEFPSWDWRNCDFRRKPEPKLVPLGPEDVPPSSCFRNQHWSNSWSMCLGAWDNQVGFAVINAENHVVTRTYKKLMEEEWEINRNDGRGWVPCQKEVA